MSAFALRCINADSRQCNARFNVRGSARSWIQSMRIFVKRSPSWDTGHITEAAFCLPVLLTPLS
eukprot:587741-Rhodomonas_salina.2